jgi:hypothetical protein
MSVQIDNIAGDVEKAIVDAQELIETTIKSSFREIINPVNHRRSVYYILVQQ